MADFDPDEPIAYTLTQSGWCEAMGISSAVAEVLAR